MSAAAARRAMMLSKVDGVLLLLDAIERLADDERLSGRPFTPAIAADDFVRHARKQLVDDRHELLTGGALTPWFVSASVSRLKRRAGDIFMLACAAAHPEYRAITG